MAVSQTVKEALRLRCLLGELGYKGKGLEEVTIVENDGRCLNWVQATSAKHTIGVTVVGMLWRRCLEEVLVPGRVTAA